MDRHPAMAMPCHLYRKTCHLHRKIYLPSTEIPCQSHPNTKISANKLRRENGMLNSSQLKTDFTDLTDMTITISRNFRLTSKVHEKYIRSYKISIIR
jgi:AraC-like DNA-binding protein